MLLQPISQNVVAPVGENLGTEDHIDDREESDHEDDLIVNTTRRASRPTDDSDKESEESEETEPSPWEIPDLQDSTSSQTLEHGLRHSIRTYKRFLAYHFCID